VKNHSPHKLKKRTGYHTTPPPKGKEKINEDQEGCRLDQEE
jgi:hypothetical protein